MADPPLVDGLIFKSYIDSDAPRLEWTCIERLQSKTS